MEIWSFLLYNNVLLHLSLPQCLLTSSDTGSMLSRLSAVLVYIPILCPFVPLTEASSSGIPVWLIVLYVFGGLCAATIICFVVNNIIAICKSQKREQTVGKLPKMVYVTNCLYQLCETESVLLFKFWMPFTGVHYSVDLYDKKNPKYSRLSIIPISLGWISQNPDKIRV